MAGKPGRPGAIRKSKKASTKGTGGNGRQALEGRGPTPRAEDRDYHPAGKRKAAQERLHAARGRSGTVPSAAQTRTLRPPQRRNSGDESEIVTGRNAVLEALKTRVPATALHVATKIELDDRVREILSLATRRSIPIMEVTRPEIDRIAGTDSVHQGVAIRVPPYEYKHPDQLVEISKRTGAPALIVALDGITDPRNLGAIIRSVGAFGGHGVVVPQRRSVGLTASAWKTSAGAAARVPVAMASNLTQALVSYKKQGFFVIGLDGGGDISLPKFQLADRPLVVVVGSEGKGLSRLVSDTCDVIMSIPISATVESLNAGIATSVTLYEIAQIRANKR